MRKQLELFDLPPEPTGEQLRDDGIERAVKHANEKDPDWADSAFNFLIQYMRKNRQFMAEEVREASDGIVAVPPSNRAWGGVIRRAAIAGFIQRLGFQSVKNPKAHCAPCTVWEVVKLPAL